MGFPHLLSYSSLSLLLFLLVLSPPTTQAQVPAPAQTPGFRCTGTRHTCKALVGYISPNSTTLSHIQSVFSIPSLSSLLAVNGLPPATPSSHRINQNQTVRIPFPCQCTNGHGTSDGVPRYVVVTNDGLDHIARDVFSGLMTYQQIQHANNITNPNLIIVGQNLTIPLPCSCDDVDGQQVVHYGYLVAPESSVEGIAAEFGTTSATLMRLNGITDPRRLMAGQLLDVPVRVCNSSIQSDSLDFPVLAANGTCAEAAPPSHNGGGKIQERGWSWALVLVIIQLLMIPRFI